MRKRRRRSKLKTTSGEGGQFFPGVQKKLAVGKPGDAFEVEADKMADTVVDGGENSAIQKKGSEEEVQQKPLTESISALQKKDLQVDEEPVQKVEEEEEAVQAMEEEEEEAIQPMEEEEEAIQPMEEEEEAVQAMEEEEEAIQPMEEEEEAVQAMEEEETLQAKSKASKASPSVETMLKKTKGKGQNLSGDILIEMNKSFGKDFSHVKIHTNDDAVKMCEKLGAQAFTNGNDIYFNAGKYSPDSVSGKHLLAHELTHTIQQSK